AVVLQHLAGGPVGGAVGPVYDGKGLAAQPGEPERLRIVGVAGYHAVAVGDQGALAFGVVGDPLNVEGVAEADLLQRAGPVVRRAELAALAFHVEREGVPGDPVQCVERGAGGVPGSVEQLRVALGLGLPGYRGPVDGEWDDVP